MKIKEIDNEGDDSYEPSDFSYDNPISQDSISIKNVKEYNLELKEWNPKFYFDEVEYFKNAFLEEKKKNKELIEEIKFFKIQREKQLFDFENIQQNVLRVVEQTKELNNFTNAIKNQENLQLKLEIENKKIK